MEEHDLGYRHTSDLIMMLIDRGKREANWHIDRIDRCLPRVEYTDSVDGGLFDRIASEIDERIPRRL